MPLTMSMAPERNGTAALATWPTMTLATFDTRFQMSTPFSQPGFIQKSLALDLMYSQSLSVYFLKKSSILVRNETGGPELGVDFDLIASISLGVTVTSTAVALSALPVVEAS